MKVKLGDVATESRETINENRQGLPIVGLEHLTPNELTLSTWDIDTVNTFTKLFRKGQMLFGRRRAYLKKAAIAPFDGICSGDITVIEAIPDKILPELLPFIIQNDYFFDFAIGKSAGSLSPRVKWEHLRLFEFNLPSFSEQRKLTDLLWAVNTTREAYKKLINLTDKIVKSRFVEMFGSITEMVRLGDLAKYRRGSFPQPYGNSEWYDGEGALPFVQVADVNNDMRLVEDTKQKISKIAQKKSIFVPQDTVIVTLQGSIGRVAITQYDCYIDRTLAVFESFKKDINKIYFAYQLQNKFSIEEKMARGVTIKTITKEEFTDFEIPFPPLFLQNQFAEFVKQADKSKFEIQRTIDTLEATYKSILRENLG